MIADQNRPLNWPRLQHQALTLRVTDRLLTPGVEDEEQLRKLAGLPSVPREPLELRREGATWEESAQRAIGSGLVE